MANGINGRVIKVRGENATKGIQISKEEEVLKSKTKGRDMGGWAQHG